MGAFILRGLLGHDVESTSTSVGNAKHTFLEYHDQHWKKYG